MLHVYMPKEDILALNVTQEYTHTIKFIWLILSTIRQNGNIMLDTEFGYFWYCFSQGSVAPCCRCGENITYTLFQIYRRV